MGSYRIAFMSTPTTIPLLRVTFHGAARTVTGSMHLVEVNRRTLLLDCGLFQGRRAEAYRRNRSFPFRPKDVDALILSHAHIDHCGNLPTLVAQGFTGPIYCTPATRDLIAVMLADSAGIQAEDAAYLNKRRGRDEPKVEPLYTLREVQRTLRACEGVPYDRPFDLGKGLSFSFADAGHLLGSAMVALRVEAAGREARLTFTGDLGRKATPILRDPAPVPACDLLLCESTYGGRTHEPVGETAELLGAVVRRTAERGGKLLIPAFSLGRTQTIVYFLHQLISKGQVPDLPIFVDSPLASQATEVFRLHPECFDDQTAELLLHDPDLFGGSRIRYLRSVKESMELNDRPGPCVIIAASGMCESGRILHHLKHHVEDARTTVLIVGYQAPNTLGHRLVMRKPEVRVLDRQVQVKAEVVVANGFSSHADHAELLEMLGPLAAQTKKVRLVHGEPEHAEALAQALRARGFADLAVPDAGETVEIP
jgi:metallo-beta-lactamase family protein